MLKLPFENSQGLEKKLHEGTLKKPSNKNANAHQTFKK